MGLAEVPMPSDPSDVEAAPDAAVSTQKPPQIGHLAAVVGLVWRTVVMWLVLLALMTLARLLG